MALSQAVALFTHIARNVYFAGLDVELLERAGYSEKFCGKGVEITRTLDSSWILSFEQLFAVNSYYVYI